MPEGWSFKEVGESARPADYSRWSLGYADKDALAFVQTLIPARSYEYVLPAAVPNNETGTGRMDDIS